MILLELPVSKRQYVQKSSVLGKEEPRTVETRPADNFRLSLNNFYLLLISYSLKRL